MNAGAQAGERRWLARVAVAALALGVATTSACLWAQRSLEDQVAAVGRFMAQRERDQALSEPLQARLLARAALNQALLTIQEDMAASGGAPLELAARYGALDAHGEGALAEWDGVLWLDGAPPNDCRVRLESLGEGRMRISVAARTESLLPGGLIYVPAWEATLQADVRVVNGRLVADELLEHAPRAAEDGLWPAPR